MRTIFIVLIMMFAAPSSAAIFKCTKGGKVVFQQTPCGSDSVSETVAPASADPFVGCFLLDPPDSTVERIDVRAMGGDEYVAAIVLTKAAGDAIAAEAEAAGQAAQPWTEKLRRGDKMPYLPAIEETPTSGLIWLKTMGREGIFRTSRGYYTTFVAGTFLVKKPCAR